MRGRLLVLTACAVAALGTGVASATAKPACAGLPAHGGLPVVDAAHVVTPQALGYLDADLLRYRIEGHASIVAATVPDLGGDDVSSYARRLFDCWGIGGADADDGVLILVAMREHRIRIELGAGLEGRVDQGQLDAAIAAMTPALKRGDVGAALRAGAVSVAGELGTPLPDTRHDPVPTATPDDVSDAVNVPPIGIDLPNGFDGYPGYAPPQHDSGGWMFGLAAIVLVVAGVGALVRAVGRVSLGAAGTDSTWRGGFPGSAGYWGTPSLFHGGRWLGGTGGSTFGSGSMGSGSMGSGSIGSGSMSAGPSGPSFGGGSSGGGGASGSW